MHPSHTRTTASETSRSSDSWCSGRRFSSTTNEKTDMVAPSVTCISVHWTRPLRWCAPGTHGCTLNTLGTKAYMRSSEKLGRLAADCGQATCGCHCGSGERRSEGVKRIEG